MRFVIGNAKIDASIINKNSSWNMMGQVWRKQGNY